jgi:glycosyltransferase involved in cell wall biosynthesis
MSIAPSPDLGPVVLVDPSDFTTPYDVALTRAIEAEGRDVRLVGQAGRLSFLEPLRYGHFYPVLASAWGRHLPSGASRIAKGAFHGLDMLRLSVWLAAFNAPVIHFQWSPIPLVDRWVIGMLQSRAPVVFTMHDSNPCQGGESWLMRRGYRGLLRAFDAIIVHTRGAENRVATIGVDPARIYRIPHGLLGDPGKPLRPRTRSHSRNRLVLLQFGKIKPYKGIDLLLEALTLVPQELRCRLEVRIVGKPYINTAWIEQFVRANGLSDCVSLRFEFVSDTEEEQLFGEADAILLPYRDIDASGVVMSAIARGLPVLATAIEGFRELFEVEGGARLITAGDPAALSKAITDWIKTPEQLDALAEAMCRKRDSIPSWNEIARLHLAVYAEAYARWLAGRARKGSPVSGRHAQ